MSNKDFINFGMPQELYDNFNKFIFSNDKKIAAKLFWRTHFFLNTLNVPGDIAECGVFKGSGMLSWLKIKQTFSPNSYKKVIGFDFFNAEEILKSLNGVDRENMAKLFSQRSFDPKDIFVDFLDTQIKNAGFNENDFELIKGDIIQTSRDFNAKRLGAKFSIIYMDLDLDVPTYHTLKNLWSNLSNGGYVIFDEYGYHEWSESNGVDRFLEEKKIKLNIVESQCPTAFFIKE